MVVSFQAKLYASQSFASVFKFSFALGMKYYKQILKDEASS